LKEGKNEFAPPLYIIGRTSLDIGEIPKSLKKRDNITDL